jgi:hypothetical protein
MVIETPKPNEIEVIIRPSVLFTIYDSVTRADQIYVVSAGSHGVSLPGGKHEDYDTEGKIRKIYEQNREVLWELLEHYKCTAKESWMRGLRTRTLTLAALTELYEELNLLPEGKLKRKTLKDYSKLSDPDEEIKTFIEILRRETASSEKPTIVNIRPYSLYIEKLQVGKTLLCLPIFKAEFRGRKEGLVELAYESKDPSGETKSGAWLEVMGLYREDRPSTNQRGKLTERKATIGGYDKDIHLSVSYIARELNEARKNTSTLNIPPLPDLESRLK